MAAKLSEISASFMRGRLPSLSSSPARWVTPISVPALSNTSTNRKLNTTMMKVSSNAREKSSWRKVGASDGGSETTPLNCASPSGMPITATTRMPIRVPPIMRRWFSAAISTKPTRQRIAAGFLRSPSVTRVAGCAPTISAGVGLFLGIIALEEQTDAGRDRELHVPRNGVDDVFADAEHRDEEEHHARAEHGGERLLPRVLVREHDREGEEGVESHAGRQRDRIVGVEAHHQRAHRRRDAGGNEHGALVHAGIAENLRIDEYDIDHGQERGDAGDQLGADVGAVLAKAEIAVEERPLGGRRGRVGHARSPMVSWSSPPAA